MMLSTPPWAPGLPQPRHMDLFRDLCNLASLFHTLQALLLWHCMLGMHPDWEGMELCRLFYSYFSLSFLLATSCSVWKTKSFLPLAQTLPENRKGRKKTHKYEEKIGKRANIEKPCKYSGQFSKTKTGNPSVTNTFCSSSSSASSPALDVRCEQT